MAARKIVQAGRKTKRRNTGPTLTLGTIKAVHDYDGNMVADVTVRGADLLGLDMTVDCVNAQPGDRCVIQEQAHHAMVTGILAKPGAWVPVTQKRIYTGSSVFQGGGGSSHNWVQLFTRDSFKDLTGRDYDNGNCWIGAYNGDNQANQVEVIGTRYVEGNPARIDAVLNKSTTSALRVNWVVIFPD